MKCEMCGISLEHNVPLDHPKHIFNKPVRKHEKLTWLKVCVNCFRTKKISIDDIVIMPKKIKEGMENLLEEMFKEGMNPSKR